MYREQKGAKPAEMLGYPAQYDLSSSEDCYDVIFGEADLVSEGCQLTTSTNERIARSTDGIGTSISMSVVPPYR